MPLHAGAAAAVRPARVWPIGEAEATPYDARSRDRRVPGRLPQIVLVVSALSFCSELGTLLPNPSRRARGSESGSGRPDCLARAWRSRATPSGSRSPTRCQIVGDVLQGDRLDRVHDHVAVVHGVGAAHLDVQPLPDPHGAADPAASNPLTKLLRENHRPCRAVAGAVARYSPAVPVPPARIAFSASRSSLFGSFTTRHSSFRIIVG